MKLRTKLAIIATLFFSFAGLSFGIKSKDTIKVSADSTSQLPVGTPTSGKLMFISGPIFASGEADCAIYCYNSSTSAWSDKSNYRMYNGSIRIMLPYSNGNVVQWEKFIVCRYNPNMNPQNDGWDGVYSQSADISFGGLFQYYQNTISVSLSGDNKVLVGSASVTNYYGIRRESNNHMYLDLSGFQDWEQGNAKFAIYFACPQFTDEKRWSSFCWKVEGQDNPHLYECHVPEYADGVNNFWNLVIAVRFSPDLAIPCWPEDTSLLWNQTNNLSFNASNDTANMIHVDNWSGGYLDAENSIFMETRVNFYGQYFIDTVSCSGSGNSDVTTSAQWDAVKYEYQNHLSTKFQGEVWKAVADKSTSASLVSQAMARYDYIVLYKQYNHEDFINRAESPNKTTYSGSYIPDSDIQNNNFVIIYIIAGVSILSLTALIILKKKHK